MLNNDFQAYVVKKNYVGIYIMLTILIFFNLLKKKKKIISSSIKYNILEKISGYLKCMKS